MYLPICTILPRYELKIWMIYQSKTLMLHTTRMMRNLVCLVPHKSRNKEMGRKNTPFGSHPLHGKASSFKNPMKEESLWKMSWLDQEFFFCIKYLDNPTLVTTFTYFSFRNVPTYLYLQLHVLTIKDRSTLIFVGICRTVPILISILIKKIN